MKTQLKRLLALNLALILLLCAVFPASAAGTAAQPAADAQPQQTAQPTEDSTQPQTTAPNPGTHTLTINGETRTIGTERQSGVGWTSVATMNGDGEPVYALTLNDYKGDPPNRHAALHWPMQYQRQTGQRGAVPQRISRAGHHDG